ncbi:sensor histidine kinase [Algoriphagus namhaensis]
MSKIFPKNTTPSHSTEDTPSIRKVKYYAIFSLILIVVASAISYWNADRIGFFTSEVMDAGEVLQVSSDLYATILERESSIRGYVLTGNTEFLQNYERSITKGDEILKRIYSLTASNSTQQDYLRELEVIIDSRVEIFEKTKVYYQATGSMEGFITEQRVENAVNKYQDIKAIIQKINDEESSNFQRNNASLLNNMRALPFIVGLISFSSIAMGLITLFSVFHYNKAQKIASEKIRNYQVSLQNKISELNDSNEELEQFAYVASHDLQEPLRKISSFSDLLMNQYRDKLEGEGILYLDRMTAAANRMRLLITDLLEYSRAGRLEMDQAEKVSLQEIVTEAMENLEVQIRESSAQIKLAELPEIKGRKPELVRVFQNLMSNSIKFSKKDEPSKIHITSSEAHLEVVQRFSWLDQGIEYVQISVEDNGIGFEPEYAERIFTIFQRLHGKSEYQGTGIGLSITRKIIEMHGGEIFAEGKPNRGALFTILLPKL